MIRSLVFVTVATVVWVLSEHPVALVFVALATVWFLCEWLRDDPEPLAPYSAYQDLDL